MAINPLPGTYVSVPYTTDNTRVSVEPILVRDENGRVTKISYPSPDYVPLPDVVPSGIYYPMGSNSDGVLFTPENYKDAAESMFGENSRWAAAWQAIVRENYQAILASLGSLPIAPPKIYPEFAPDPIAARISNLEIDDEKEPK